MPDNSDVLGPLASGARGLAQFMQLREHRRQEEDRKRQMLAQILLSQAEAPDVNQFGRQAALERAGKMIAGEGQNPLAGILGDLNKRVTDVEMPEIRIGADASGLPTAQTQTPLRPYGEHGKLRGDYTNADLADRREFDMYRRKQGLLDRRDEANDQRTRERMESLAGMKIENQLTLQKQRQEHAEAMAFLRSDLKSQEKLRARQVALIAAGVSPADAERTAGAEIIEEIKANLANLKARTNLAEVRADDIPVAAEDRRRRTETGETNAVTNRERAGTYADSVAQQGDLGRQRIDTTRQGQINALLAKAADHERRAAQFEGAVLTDGRPDPNAKNAAAAERRQAETLRAQAAGLAQAAGTGAAPAPRTGPPRRPPARRSGAPGAQQQQQQQQRSYPTTEAAVRAHARAKGLDEETLVQRARAKGQIPPR